ncbi:MAG: hypothetical protein ETSY1_13720 [Candidatus Entotheonella factor]|uniref:JmjC domain-containing protein n=1 Tax=Entotheonella factor TaxID=1429438 RepID=W4LQY0_ENTF1|nr:cupin domain-containing protein [Candidatus Entotheonella palauensis]ETW99786.1 MAG: hypothetical protein ETSY1_13720 [Candidatus Entotheonella factor]
MDQVALSDTFWLDFIEQYWEQAPTVWHRLHTPAIATANELFETVVAMTSRSKSDRFWVAKQTPVRNRDDYAIVSLDHFGPKRDDASLDGFFSRVRQGFNARPMGVNIHQLQLANPSLWFRLRQFIRGLIDGTCELPTQRWDIDTFFGTYEATPFGIHRDNASVFAFGVLGQRTYYFWPADAFKPDDPSLGTPDLAQLAPYLPDAKRIDIGPGDMVYWPSNHWHVVASDGQPSAVVQISAYFGTRLSHLIGQHVQRLLQAQLGRNDMRRTYSRHKTTTELPQVLADAQGLIGRIWQDGLLDDELQRFWLAHLTADGFTAVPPAQTGTQLHQHTSIAVQARDMIAWRQNVTEHLGIAANGLTHTVHDATELREMLAYLQSGQTTTMAELICRFARDQDQVKVIEQILSWLYRCRALIS